jgi:Methylenetetrahydrofolate reductase
MIFYMLGAHWVCASIFAKCQVCSCHGQSYGIHQATEMCRQLLDAGIPGLHMYTLNLERSAIAILENVGLITKTRVRQWLTGAPILRVPSSWLILDNLG